MLSARRNTACLGWRRIPMWSCYCDRYRSFILIALLLWMTRRRTAPPGSCTACRARRSFCEAKKVLKIGSYGRLGHRAQRGGGHCRACRDAVRHQKRAGCGAGQQGEPCHRRFPRDGCRPGENNVKLLPVDSEHSAIFQCLQDEYSAKSLQKILLTASGGRFRPHAAGAAECYKDDALRHPNWSMGSKITIDSATLMNKGLELIEAVWLFGLPAEQVQVVVQRQSIIHSMVQFSDNSILAQLGGAGYAHPHPVRASAGACARPCAGLDFTKLHELTFDTADEATFRCLAACKKAIGKGGLAPCAANGANEEAVRLFLEGRIPFLKIGELVEGVVDSEAFGGPYTLDDVYACDAAARAYVLATCILKRMGGGAPGCYTVRTARPNK